MTWTLLLSFIAPLSISRWDTEPRIIRFDIEEKARLLLVRNNIGKNVICLEFLFLLILLFFRKIYNKL